MIIASSAFEHNTPIPGKFTCTGGDVNPELLIQNIPSGAKSLALIMDDPDASRGTTFTHWLVWNISPATQLIKEESVPPQSVEGVTDFGRIGYGGPCPPASPAGQSPKPHRYFFKLYALDTVLSLPEGASKADLEAEIEDHIIEEAELVGLYAR